MHRYAQTLYKMIVVCNMQSNLVYWVRSLDFKEMTKTDRNIIL